MGFLLLVAKHLEVILHSFCSQTCHLFLLSLLKSLGLSLHMQRMVLDLLLWDPLELTS